MGNKEKYKLTHEQETVISGILLVLFSAGFGICIISIILFSYTAVELFKILLTIISGICIIIFLGILVGLFCLGINFIMYRGE